MGNANLIDLMTQQEAEEKAAAREEYRSILQADNPTADQAVALRGCMATLNKTAADLQRDQTALEQEATYEAAIRAEDDPDLTAKIAAAGAALQAHKTAVAERERADKHRERELFGVLTTLNRKRDAGTEARRKLTELREAHRELFGLPPAPPPQQPSLNPYQQPIPGPDFTPRPPVQAIDPGPLRIASQVPGYVLMSDGRTFTGLGAAEAAEQAIAEANQAAEAQPAAE